MSYIGGGASTVIAQPANGLPVALLGGGGLLSGLTHYWPLNESSGTRSDSVGTAHFSSVNSVVSMSGKNNNGAQLLGSTAQALTYSAMPADGSTAVRGLSLWGWVNKAQVNYSFPLYRAATTQYGTVLSVALNGFAGSLIDITWTDYGVGTPFARIAGASVPDQTWFHLAAWLDSDGYVRAKINNGATQISSTQHTFNFQPGGGASPVLTIGPSSAAAGILGVDELALWTRPLTTDEITALYNSGAGKFYPTF